MATFGEYNGAGSATTKLLLHLNGNSSDSSGNSNNGSDTAITYSLANGNFGQGAGFNGSSSAIVAGDVNGAYGSTGLADSTKSFTFSCWFKRAAIGSNHQFFQARKTSGNGDGVDFLLDSTNLFQIRFTNSAGAQTWIQSASFTDTTNWHNVVFVYTGGTPGTGAVYIDGSTYGGISATSAVRAWSLAANEAKFDIGGFKSWANTNYFNGNMDEIILENVAWDASKVAKQYSYAKGRFGIL